jgi:hypothetical protein
MPAPRSLPAAVADLLQAGQLAIELLDDASRRLNDYTATADPELSREIAAAEQRWRLASAAFTAAIAPQETAA